MKSRQDKDQETGMDSPSITVSVVDPDQASQEFVGRWNRLVSTTNWEKGRIILQWRESLMAAQASPQEYADEAWSRRVGGVTGQHAGRLRRVCQRFAAEKEKFPGLFWSHFQAALDWDDAEMWLEGAVQSRWSVNAMRNKRWETLGADAEMASLVDSELDEDFEPALNQDPEDLIAYNITEIHGSAADEKEVRKTPEAKSSRQPKADAHASDEEVAPLSEEPPTSLAAHRVRPFESLPELPEDVIAAFEAYKLAILYHKRLRWSEISRQDLLSSLDALRQLALAPSGEE